MKFTTGELNLMKKYSITDIDAPATETVYNPISGVPVKLNKAGLHTYATIMNMMANYERGVKINVSEFDRLRYLFSKVWHPEYMDLLD
jgi:hypothetical protein